MIVIVPVFPARKNTFEDPVCLKPWVGKNVALGKVVQNILLFKVEVLGFLV